jgi:HlyD family secretion protein
VLKAIKNEVVFMIWQKVKQYKKWFIFAIVVAFIAAGGAAYWKKSSTVVATEKTVAVERGDVMAVISATGTISAVNSVTVSSRVTGLITEVRVKENDIVKAGQVLLVLDDTAVRAQVAQYQATLANYAAVYERSKKLAAIGAESLQQLDSDKANYLTAQATYDNNVSQLGYYIITSPVDGMVIGTPTPAGETVVQGISAAQSLLTIADMSKMQIKTLVDETDIGKVKLGQQVSFTVDAQADKTFTGKVTSISRSATTSSNVVYYPVYVEVDSPEDLLFPTMTARVTITVGERKNVLVVPLAAIGEENGQKYVQVMVNGKVQRMPVTIGLKDDQNIEILSGLSDADQIVIPISKASTTAAKQNQVPPPRM